MQGRRDGQFILEASTCPVKGTYQSKFSTKEETSILSKLKRSYKTEGTQLKRRQQKMKKKVKEVPNKHFTLCQKSEKVDEITHSLTKTNKGTCNL